MLTWAGRPTTQAIASAMSSGCERRGAGVNRVGLGAVAAEADGAEFAAADEAGFEVGDADTGADEVGFQIGAQLSDEGLASAVDVAAGIGVAGGGAADVDDVAVVALDHAGQERVGHAHQAGDVGADHGLPILEHGGLGGGDAEGEAGVVDEDVDLAPGAR